jgi:peptidoglycan/LPS O-acetylase OafA/YrhL
MLQPDGPPGAMAASGGSAISAPAWPSTATRRSGRRWDIQALRGLAVLFVVLQHARVPYLPGGFLGVDIFFVISGYLMGGIIAGDLDAGRFTFRGFYARRIRRLLPAAYATIIVTALLSAFVLDGFEFDNFARQVLGSFTFTVNIVLWQQVDYFNSAAILKPLLHMWSLAIEEQYYLVLPMILLICPARFRLGLCALLVAFSGLFCALMLARSASATFYFLPTRAWELGLGTVVALLERRGIGATPVQAWLRPACALFLVAAPFLFDEVNHPGLPAVGVCMATAFLLITRGAAQAPSMLGPLTLIGDRSYSLYLVHWPVFALINNLFITDAPPGVNVLALLLCLAWMEAQYRWVEEPLRHMRVGARQLAVLVALAVIVTAGTFAWARHYPTEVMKPRQEREGLADACAYRGTFVPQPECQTSDRPGAMVWGDSFAMHLAAGMAAVRPDGIIQATEEVCGPFLGIAPMDGVQYRKGWARDCMLLNDTVLADLARRDDVKTVVLSSSLIQYIPGAEDRLWRLLVRTPQGFEEKPLDTGILLDALGRTVAAIRAAGKRVVMIAPPPSLGFDIGRCQERSALGLLTISPYAGCSFSRADYETKRRSTLDFLEAVRARGDVDVISFDTVLCGSGICQSNLDGVSLYRDSGHFSNPGSVAVARRMKLGDLAEQHAR